MQVAGSFSGDPSDFERDSSPAATPSLAVTTGEFDARCLELRPMLASYLRAMLPDHCAVDDCLQETFIVLWQRYSGTKGDDLRRVAFTCAKHKAHGWLSQNKVGRLSIVDPEILIQIAEAAARSAGEMGPAGTKSRVAALRQCLAGLSPEQRNLIEARYGDKAGESLAVLAGKVDRKIDALYKQLERIRGVLKQCVSHKLKSDP